MGFRQTPLGTPIRRAHNDEQEEESEHNLRHETGTQ